MAEPDITIENLIRWGREERHLEYKRSMSWVEPTTKAKITKSALAMANLQGGGNIVVGVARQPDDSYLADGMDSSDFDSFIQDHVSAYLSEHADPYIEATLVKHEFAGKNFVILRIREFAELPVVCKKDGLEKLRRGALYIRSRRIPETVEVPTQVEMREILDLALEKRSRTFARQAQRMGFVQPATRNEFDQQLVRLPNTPLLAEISSHERWRVRICPTEFERARFQDLRSCFSFMISKAVDANGWQYPFVAEHAIQEGTDWISSERDFRPSFPFMESWTLFRSAQFIHNFSMAERFIGTSAWPLQPQFFVPGKDKRYLNISHTIQTVTGIFEFSARMAYQGVLTPSATISIELHGVAGRELAYMIPRHQLDGRYSCKTDQIELVKSATAAHLQANARELALETIVEIFGKFGWSTAPISLIRDEQTRVFGS